MTNLLKSNIEKIRNEYGLNKKDIDVFSNNLAVSFKGYPLFEYFADYKYDIKKMKKFWKVSLKTMLDKTFFLSDSKEANSLAIFSPYEKGGVSIWKTMTIGGTSKINIGGSWKKAIPYVKVNGSWKPTISYIKANSNWKRGQF